MYAVESIEAKRKTGSGVEYLTKWVGYAKCTWVPSDQFVDPFIIERFEVQQAIAKFQDKVQRKLAANDFDPNWYHERLSCDGQGADVGTHMSMDEDDDEGSVICIN